MKIAFVVYDYNRYIGHSRYTVELASRFRRDHDVHVFANTVDDPDIAGITFHHVPAVRRNVFTSALTFLAPATLYARGRFHVVHAQGLTGLSHNLATAHMCLGAWFSALDRERVPLNWRRKLFRNVITKLEKRALCQPSTRRVIAVSERVRADLATYYGRKEGVDVVYHGTDTVAFHPDNRDRYRKTVRMQIGVSDDSFLALYVGDYQKGCLPAIQAVARVPGIILLAVSNANPSVYREQAESLGVANRVIFVPFTQQVERVYAAADAFLFPTRYDSFGLVITEAMATGLPVVTSLAAGAAELITDEVNGMLISGPWNVEEMAIRLTRLRDDAKLRDRLGSAARARVEPFTWDRTADETLSVYRLVTADS